MSTKVTLILTDNDMQNVSYLMEHANVRNRTHTVSAGLSLMRFVVEAMQTRPGSRLLIETPDHEFERLIMPELEAKAQLAAGSA